jgi:signal transduction histidine kinase/CheY-like chemotaxis protein
VAGSVLVESGLAAKVVAGVPQLVQELEKGAEFGVVAEEALADSDLKALADWIEKQAEWSDFPFILLTRRGGGLERNPEANRFLEILGNVTFLERPFHPTTLVSLCKSALRVRHRQYDARARLEELDRLASDLRELAASLETKIGDRTRDLAQANDRLTAEIAERERAEERLVQAQKMEAVGQLTGGLAHDFNNLLTAVVGSLDLLLRRTDDERLRKLAGNALQAAERGAQLTSQLLAFSRRQRLQPTPLNPNDVISNMGDLMARTIGPHIRIETRLDPQLWNALADKTQIEVIILNLALNARDAMPAGGRLTIATANIDHVPSGLSTDLAPGEYVAISVADTGTGMTPEVRARAFEPFFTTKEQGRGTGLGLSQLYGFAKQSGGTARIESAEGQGTTVSIYLPRTQAATILAEVPQSRPSRRERLQVLLVDDDDGVREVCSAMLEDIGCVVIAAASGEEALRELARTKFNIMLTDIAMPAMSGVELAKRTRELAPEMPILFASGYADLQAFGELLTEETVVRKPYRLSELAARLEAMIDQHRAENVVELRPR